MTIKDLMTAVSDRLDEFPKGWNTEAKDAFKALGREHYERRQKRIWILTIREAEADEDLVVSAHRSFAGAKKAMEEDIEDTLSHRQRMEEDCGLVRAGECSAKIGTAVSWEISEGTLGE